mgnify:FL=1
MSSYYEKMLVTGEVKCIDEEIPFDVPNGWEWCRIASLADVVRGGSPRPAGSPIFYDGSIPFLKVADLTRESSIYVKSFSSTIKEAGLSKTRLVKAGTLLLTNSGATLGVPKICTFDTTFNDGVAAFLSLDERLKLYVYWFFCYMTDLYRNINQGTAQPNLNTDIIKMTLVPIPPYKEQIRIIEQLGNISPIIAYYEKVQDELDELNESIPKLIKQSILQEAIRGKLVPQIAEEGTAQELLEQIKTEKQKLVKEGKLKKSALNDSVIFRDDDNKYYEQIGKKCLDITDEIPFPIPNNWAWSRLSSMCSIVNGFTPLRSESKFWDCGTINWFTVEDIKNQGEMIYSTKQKITDEATSKERIVRAGSVLLCCTASVGQCALAKIDLTTNQQFNALTVKDVNRFILTDNYLFWFAKTLKATLQRLSGKTTFEFVSVKKVGNILIPIPPFQEQQRIVAQIEKLFEQLR